MKEWLVAMTVSGISHVMERVEPAGVVVYCSQNYLTDRITHFEHISTVPTCIVCAAWWHPGFGAI
jgi:hypothetical protein